MKFQLVLDEKSLTREDLPKSQQLKIKEIEKLKTQIEQIESDGVEDSFQDEFDKIKLQFDQADEEVVVFIRNFDVEKSRKQRERLAEMRDRKKKLSEEFEEPALEKPEPVSVPEPVAPAPVQAAPVQPASMPQTTEVEKLESLREAQVYPEQFEEEQEEAEEYEAEEEFEKVGDSKPRKLNVPLVIMGVGALLLTWGAVNFFKNKE
jgi:hypothetical protein